MTLSEHELSLKSKWVELDIQLNGSPFRTYVLNTITGHYLAIKFKSVKADSDASGSVTHVKNEWWDDSKKAFVTYPPEMEQKK